MRHDIQPNERAFSSKQVAEEVGLATTTVRKYGQVLERNGYEFFKDGDRRIFVRSDIEAIIAIRDSDKSQDDTAKDIVEQQQKRMEELSQTSTSTELANTSDYSLQDPSQLREMLRLVANELATTNEMNVQLKQEMSYIKTTVSQLQQDHHVISSGVGNFSQKTHNNMQKLMEQQKTQYENLLEEEKQKSEFLLEEIKNMREEQKQEWRLQNDFNNRLEQSVSKPKSFWEKLRSVFRG